MTKKPFIIAGTGLALIALALWITPLVTGVPLGTSRKMYFSVGKCGCNHDMFLLVEGSSAYDYTPGHKVKRWLAHVARTGNQLTLYKTDPSTPIIELKSEPDGYQIRFPQARDTSWTPVKRVTNPLRTTLPLYLPE